VGEYVNGGGEFANRGQMAAGDPTAVFLLWTAQQSVDLSG